MTVDEQNQKINELVNAYAYVFAHANVNSAGDVYLNGEFDAYTLRRIAAILDPECPKPTGE